MAILVKLKPPYGTAPVFNCLQFWRSHVAGGLLLSRARFLVRLHSKITIFSSNNETMENKH